MSAPRTAPSRSPLAKAARACLVGLVCLLAAPALAQNAPEPDAPTQPLLEVKGDPALAQNAPQADGDAPTPTLLEIKGKGKLDTTQTQSNADAADTSPDAAQADDSDQPESIPGDPWGDVQGQNVIALRVLFQARYASTFADKSDSSRASYAVREDYLAQQGDGWSINKMFVRLSSDPVKYVGFKAVLDFAELIGNNPENVLKQAYATLSPMPGRVEFVAGLFKLPFSIPELDPSSRYEFASFGPTNDLLGDLGYAGRDLGLQLLVAPLKKKKRLRLSVGIFQGHAKDEHDSPAGSLAGRIEVKPSKSLRFGVDTVQHLNAITYDRPFNTSDNDVLPNPPDPLYPAQKRWDKGGAYGVDARFKKKGFMARGEFVYGDRVDIDRRYDARRFWSAWGILAYGFAAGPVKLIPALRGEWLDTDPDHGNGAYRTISGSVSTVFLSRVRIMIDATYTDVEANTPLIDQPKPLQAMPYLALDQTRIVAQLQLEL